MLNWLKVWIRKWVAEDTVHGEIARGPRTIEEGAAELMQRARTGDQVAMAQMMLIKDKANDPNAPEHERAKKSLAALWAYGKAHPIQSDGSFGAELRKSAEADRLARLMTSTMGSEEVYPRALVNMAPEIAKNSVSKAVVTLANGPSLLERGVQEPLIKVIADSIEDPQAREAFALGVKHSDQVAAAAQDLPPQCQAMLRLGYLLGQARKIQAVRLRQTPVSAFCPDVGWELGEGPDVQS